MNKQELIEELEKLKFENTDEASGKSAFYNKAIEAGIFLAKQLDEPQRPVVSKFVAEEFLKKSKYSTDVIDLFSEVEYATDSDGLILEKWGWSVDFYDWLAKDSDTLYILCDALRYGYEVEKEPSYCVKIGKGYFSGFDETKVTYVIDDAPESLAQRIKYDSKEEAEMDARQIGGTVEEVVEG